jgi:N-acyl amino acid synthase of PEP-CTERM/exosortase system
MHTVAQVRSDSNHVICDKQSQQRRSIDLFGHYLTVIQANSKELLDSAFRLRFQVYCRERGFENAAAFPDGRERDDDDARSLHFLVLHRPTNSAIGTVRLILPRVGIDLPVLRLVGSEYQRRAHLPRETTAEVSRFAVPKAFGKRLLGDLWHGNGHPSITESGPRPMLSLLTFGLIRAVVMMSLAGGITHIVAMMEPALLRLLRPFGIEFHPIGKPVEHHGLRQPGWAAMAHLADRVKKCHPELWELATDAGRRVPGQLASARG